MSLVRRSSPPVVVFLLLVAAASLVPGPATSQAAAPAGNGGAPAAGTAPNGTSTEQPEDRLWPIRSPTRARGATVARVVVSTRGRLRLARPGLTTRVDTETAWSGQTQTLLALRGAERGGRKWVQVLLGSRPNGRTAWVRRDHVVLGTTRWWVDVSVRLRRVTVYHDGRRARRFRAVVGAPRTPTPRTLSAVYERNRQPDPRAFLGPWAIALTAHSTVLENYGGGPGRVAIHGRAGASLLDPLGSARSHGCVRIDNAVVRYLAARLPPGTPVDLRK